MVSSQRDTKLLHLRHTGDAGMQCEQNTQASTLAAVTRSPGKQVRRSKERSPRASGRQGQPRCPPKNYVALEDARANAARRLANAGYDYWRGECPKHGHDLAPLGCEVAPGNNRVIPTPLHCLPRSESMPVSATTYAAEYTHPVRTQIPGR